MKKRICALLAACAASLFAKAEEIDITAAVREAGLGTTTNETGTVHSGFSLSNAFGTSTAKADRVMMQTPFNRIVWSIDKAFEEGKSVIVTRYVVRRTTFDGNVGDWEDVDYSRKRAPGKVLLQGSTGGWYWITLDERDIDWLSSDEMEREFTIDPLYVNSYRYYRFVTANSNASEWDSVKCGFQYVKLIGTVGDTTPLMALNRKVEYLVASGSQAASIPDFGLAFDSKIEIDLTFTDLSIDHTAIFAAGYPDSEDKIRLFYSKTKGGWWYQYGTTEVATGVKAYAGARYKIVADGPDLSVNGVKIGSAGERRTGAANGDFSLFGNASDAWGATNLYFYNCAYAKVYSVKHYDGEGNLVHDLRPVLYRDGGCRLYDAVTKENAYGSSTKYACMPADFQPHKWLTEITSSYQVGVSNATITLVKGECTAGYSVTNCFTEGMDIADRALFNTEENVIQYDINEDYHPGYPMVVTRLGILPCVSKEGLDYYSRMRAPGRFELQASKDGTNEWVTLCKRDIGCGPGAYASTTWLKKDTWGVDGIWIDVPEDVRGDYRHYRFITTDTSADEGDSVKMSLQRIRFLGYDGGFEPACEPVEYIQNAVEQQNGNNTYVKTGVVPMACDLTIEMTGSFTRTDVTECLFCSRDNDGNNTWTLFLLGGKLRLDCKTTGTPSSFAPVANKVYTIKVAKNELYVDGEKIYSSGSTDFKPGSEIVLLASHRAAGWNWDNQARFKLHSCKITDSTGALVRDYSAAKQSDGTVGLLDRRAGYNGSHFTASSGQNALAGPAVDSDFHQRDRSVTLLTEAANDRLPDGPITLGFGDNQRLAAQAYAAFDNAWRGNSTNGWAKVVSLGPVTNGLDSITVTLENPEEYRRVKFFVCDDMERGISHTKTYKALSPGMILLVK